MDELAPPEQGVPWTAPEPSAGLVLPTRIITYAWGEKYIKDLVSVTLPALLAPGNLPHLVRHVPTELIIVSKAASFPRIRAEPSVRRIEGLCPLRLVALDDLISAPDQYGMALTHVLHRGFSDLGAAMTDAWMIFLNADFVLAANSLSTLLSRLQAGERLVASPSYCVNAEEVLPKLLARVDPISCSLSISHREMADLVLQHRHNTIRAKTVNRPSFGIRYVDQFYWLHDDLTLLGHQMPVAIVGMRPERFVARPNSYWDHGLMREYCPTVEHCVIGDSDEFLMLELRGAETARDQLDNGSAEPLEIARNWASFMTPYQRDMVRYPLTLHAGELPPGVEQSRRDLGAFVDNVMSHLPASLPSHIEHPQWTYHWPRFVRFRHAYLSRHLGAATEADEPPEDYSELDRLWWRLDGLKKGFERQRDELEFLRQSQIGALTTARDQLDEAFRVRRGEIGAHLPAGLFGWELQPPLPRDGATPPRVDFFCGDVPHPQTNSALNDDRRTRQVAENARDLLALREIYSEKRRQLSGAVNSLDEHYKGRTTQLTAEFEAALNSLQLRYEHAVGKPPRSALIPHVAFQKNRRPDATDQYGLLRRVHRTVFGKFPQVRRTSPYWTPLRHVQRIVDQAAMQGAADALVVVGGSGVPNTFADALTGTRAEVALAEAVEGHLSIGLGQAKFDLCVCDLAIAELGEFGKLVQAAAPSMRSGGKIVGFCPNFGLQPIAGADAKLRRDIADLPDVTIHYAGSERAARLLRRFNASGGSWRSAGKMSAISAAIRMIALAPSATKCAQAEERADSTSPRDMCISITVEVGV